MIFASNIEYAIEMDDHFAQTPGFEDFTGLGNVNFYTVVHFNCFPFEEATRTVIRENNHLPLKPITNEQAIVVVWDKISIRGKMEEGNPAIVVQRFYLSLQLPFIIHLIAAIATHFPFSITVGC